MSYCTADELKFELQAGNTDFTRDDDLIQSLVDEASAAIDNYTKRNFNVPSSATARYFRSTHNGYEVYQLDDLATSASLAVATDTSFNGTYTTLDSDSWFAEVDNVTGMVTHIFSTSGFPVSLPRRTIKVTGYWGYPSVPEPVHRACILWARRLYVRKDSPSGVLGFANIGAIRISTVDPDVRALLDPYVRLDRMIA